MARGASLSGLILLSGLIVANLVISTPALAGECRPLSTPVSGEGKKYSVVADVYGVMAFADIICAVYWRDHQLCGSAGVAFQISAVVFDYYRGEEVPMTKAHYVAGAAGKPHPVAFVSQEEAERFRVEAGGELLSYRDLAGLTLK